MDSELAPNKLLRSLQESSDPIFAIDAQQRIHLWTQGMVKMTGMTPQEVGGKFCFDILQGKDAFGNDYCCERCPIIQTMERKEIINPFELFIAAKNGSARKRIRCSHVLMMNQEEESPICVYMLEELGASATPESDRSQTLLSKRELEVLRCLAQGMDPPAISAKLEISESTVRNHIQNTLTKFGVHSRVEAVVRAYQEKLV